MRANRLLNRGLIIFSVIIILVSSYITFLYVRNEKSKIYFKVSSISEINWKSGTNSLNIDGALITLTIDDEKVVNNKRFELDPETGKINIKGEDEVIYLRSVSDDAIVIWYKEAEYRLIKEVVYK